jgi:choline dehydrogenase-like flavoprotein
VLPQPRGRVLGGTSAINFQLVLYPSQRDLDSWASLGNSGWNWKDVEQYYHKSSTLYPPSDETRKLLNLDYACEKPTGDGPIQLSFGDGYTPANKAWIDTWAKLGYGVSDEPIKGACIGGFTHPASIDPKTKFRSYAANTYYSPEVATRPNLHVLTEAHVDKILLEGTDRSAVAKGIKVTSADGTQHEISATDEVILSAGTLHSPKLLELSGIGGKDLLESHGIPVLVDNANVGENLQDHPIVCQSFEVNEGMPSGDILRNPAILGAVIQQYQASREGPLGSSSIASSYLPLSNGSELATPEEVTSLVDGKLDAYHDFPGKKEQYELLRETLSNPKEAAVQHHLFPSQINIKPTGYSSLPDVIAPTTDGNYLTLMTMLNREFSRGFCHIQSADPSQKVKYDPRFCSHPLDIEILARHVAFLETLLETEPLASVFKKDGRRIPALKPSTSDLETAREVVRQSSLSVFHISGTCAMMPREAGGVVNERLVVHGTKNLRVVDASIFPLEPVGNIQMTVYAVAEKAADIIKADRARG